MKLPKLNSCGLVSQRGRKLDRYGVRAVAEGFNHFFAGRPEAHHGSVGHGGFGTGARPGTKKNSTQGKK